MAKITTERQYKAIMERIDSLFFEIDENTPKNDPRLVELDLLSALVEEYEKEAFPVSTPTLSQVMIYKLSEMKITQRELSKMLGMSAPRLNAILKGKAYPTFEQAKSISVQLNIDPAIVLG